MTLVGGNAGDAVSTFISRIGSGSSKSVSVSRVREFEGNGSSDQNRMSDVAEVFDDLRMCVWDWGVRGFYLGRVGVGEDGQGEGGGCVLSISLQLGQPTLAHSRER